MSYAEAKAFLAKHTRVLELSNGRGARVAVCPGWQGRVMTSTCDGPQGRSFGFIHREFIEHGQTDLKFNNYGAEDRMWLSPEGGQFSLWFKPGQPQKFDHWFTPPAFNEGAWTVTSAAGPHASPDAADAVPERLGHGLRPGRYPRRAVAGADDLKGLFGPSVERHAAKLVRKTGGLCNGQLNHQSRRRPDEGKGPGLDLDPGHAQRRPTERDHRSLSAGGRRRRWGRW